MTIDLTPELEDLVHTMVASGRYGSANDVVAEALRLMGERDRIREVEAREIRRRVDLGLAQAQRGETDDGEAFMDGLLRDLDARCERVPATAGKI